VDFLWWLAPTHPELKTNYFERVWPKKEVRQMYRMDVFDMPEEDSDPDKRLFIIEQRRAQFEKKIFWLTILACVFIWIFVVQDMCIDYGIQNYQWKDVGLPDPEPTRNSRWKL
jgi:hypothetical protein